MLQGLELKIELHIRINHFVNVSPGGDTELSLPITMKGHAEVVFNRTCSLELEPMNISQCIENSLGVFQSNCKIIHIHNVLFIVVADMMHPDIWFCLRWGESHITKAIQEPLMHATLTHLSIIHIASALEMTSM